MNGCSGPPPLARIFPSGLKAALDSPPRSECSSLPVATSQILLVLAKLTEASFAPSGLNATAVSAPGCFIVRTSVLGLTASQREIVPPIDPVATHFPSGLTAVE